MARDHGCAQNAVGALLDMDFHESVLFAVGYRAIDIVHQDCKRAHLDAFLLCLAHIQANMGDFRVAIGAPGDRQLTPSFTAREQRISYRDSAAAGKSPPPD